MTIPYYLDQIFRSYRYIKRQQKTTRSFIDMLWYELENVKGIDYTKTKGTSINEDERIRKYYRLSDELQRKESEIEIMALYLATAERILKRIINEDLKEEIIKRYLEDPEPETAAEQIGGA